MKRTFKFEVAITMEWENDECTEEQAYKDIRGAVSGALDDMYDNGINSDAWIENTEFSTID